METNIKTIIEIIIGKLDVGFTIRSRYQSICVVGIVSIIELFEFTIVELPFESGLLLTSSSTCLIII
jgi:hypothetical protein